MQPGIEPGPAGFEATALTADRCMSSAKQILFSGGEPVILFSKPTGKIVPKSALGITMIVQYLTDPQSHDVHLTSLYASNNGCIQRLRPHSFSTKNEYSRGSYITFLVEKCIREVA